MFKIVCLLAICLTSASALPRNQRIVGGTVVNINQRPFGVALLYAPNNVNFRQDCGGSILNNGAVLSAAHCWVLRGSNPTRSRVRVGSTNSNSGGAVHNVARLITHPNYNMWSYDNDIGVIRITPAFTFNNNVQPGPIAGPNYNLADNQYVWAIGWGMTGPGQTLSEQLRQVQLRTVNQGRCHNMYSVISIPITPTMLCAGWEAGGRGSCSGDSGSPLLHNNVVVGVTAFGSGCGDGRFPTVYARVSSYTGWIQANA